jgi:predicted small lipoprotein YifL
LFVSLPFAPIAEKDFDPFKAAHLLWRAGFGGTWEEAESLARCGLKGAVAALVNFPPSQENTPPAFAALPQDDDRTFNQRLQNLPEAEKQKLRNDRQHSERDRITELRFWWLKRMLQTGVAAGGRDADALKSPLLPPLEEKLTLFWHGHFATSFDDKIQHAFPMWQQNQMFRRLALAPFPELLSALIRDPAMLVYLDNAQSHKGRPNENFGRELMELHSLGVGNYTEADVKAAARGLTGWSVKRENWRFEKHPGAHDDGEKTYLGQTGNWDGDDVVRIICAQPACARFIARKLLEFFVSENPDPNVLEAAASIYRESGYDTRAFLTTLFSSQLFYSKSATDSIIKSPVALTIGALKSMRVAVPEKAMLVNALRQMGQDLFFPPDVNGWPGGAAWINSNMLLVRYNFANYLLNGVNPDQFKMFSKNADGTKRRDFVERQRDPRAIQWSPRAQLRESGLDRKLITASDIVDHYIKDFLARPVSPELRSQLMTFAETDAAGGRRSFSLNDTNFDERVRDLTHLIMSSPDYQLC